MDRLNEILLSPLSPQEVKVLGRGVFNMPVDVVLYDEVIKARHIDDLLDKHPNIVLFYPNMKQGPNISGHYVCMFLRGNTVYFYDSYSSKPDDQKKGVHQRDELYREQQNSLINLLLNSGYDVDYSPFRHQKLSNDSSTCGRHSIMRLAYRHIDNDAYDKEIKRLCKKFGLDPDQLVSLVVSDQYTWSSEAPSTKPSM